MVSIPVYLEVAASKLCMIHIVGGNYCKIVIKVRSAKKYESGPVFLAFSHPHTYS